MSEDIKPDDPKPSTPAAGDDPTVHSLSSTKTPLEEKTGNGEKEEELKDLEKHDDPDRDEKNLGEEDNEEMSSQSDWPLAENNSGLGLVLRPISKAMIDVATEHIFADRPAATSPLTRFITSTHSVYKTQRACAYLVRDFDKNSAIAIAARRADRVLSFVDRDDQREDAPAHTIEKDLDPDGAIDALRAGIKSGDLLVDGARTQSVILSIVIDGPQSAWLSQSKLSQLEVFCKTNHLFLSLFLQPSKHALLSHFVEGSRGNIRPVLVMPWGEFALETINNKLIDLQSEPLPADLTPQFLDASNWVLNAKHEAIFHLAVQRFLEELESGSLNAIDDFVKELRSGTLLDPEKAQKDYFERARNNLKRWLGLQASEEQDLTKAACLFSLALAQSHAQQSVTVKRLEALVCAMLGTSAIPEAALNDEERVALKERRKQRKKAEGASEGVIYSWKERYLQNSDRLWFELDVVRAAEGTISLPKEVDAIELASLLFQLAPSTAGKMANHLLLNIADWLIESRFAMDDQFSMFDRASLISIVSSQAAIMGRNFESGIFLNQISDYVDANWQAWRVANQSSEGSKEDVEQSADEERDGMLDLPLFSGVLIADIVAEFQDALRKIEMTRKVAISDPAGFKRALLSRVGSLRTKATILAWLFSFHQSGDDLSNDLASLLSSSDTAENKKLANGDIAEVIEYVVRIHLFRWQRRRSKKVFATSWKHWVQGLSHLDKNSQVTGARLRPNELLRTIMDLCIEADVHPDNSTPHSITSEEIEQKVELFTLRGDGDEVYRHAKLTEIRTQTIKFHYRSYSDMPPPASSSLIFEDGDDGETVRAVAKHFFDVSPFQWQLTRKLDHFAKRLQDLQTVVLGGCNYDWFGERQPERRATLARLSERAFRAMVAAHGPYAYFKDKVCDAVTVTRHFNELKHSKRDNRQEIEYRSYADLYGLFWPAILLHWRCREFGVGAVQKDSDDFRRLSRFLTLTVQTCSEERIHALSDGLETLSRILQHEVAFAIDHPEAMKFYEQKADAARKTARFMKNLK